MGVFTRGSIPALFTPGLRKAIALQFASAPWFYTKFIKELPSTKKTETDMHVYGIQSVPQTPEGAEYDYGQLSSLPNYSITHLTYKYGLRITKEAQEDELYGIAKKLPEFLARAMRYTIEVAFHDPINSGFSNVGYDGKATFALDHPSLVGNQANRPTPDVDLGVASLKAGRIAMRNLETYEGHPIVWDKGLLAYHPDNDPVVFELLQSEKVPYRADQTMNWLYGSFQPFSDPFITDVDSWVIAPETPQEDGMIGFWRVKPNAWSDVDVNNDDLLSKIRARNSSGCNEFRKYYGSSGGT